MKKERAVISSSPSQQSSLPAQRRNDSGVAGVTIGILALLLPAIYGIVLGVTALVFGIVQQRSLPSRWSISSIILGVLAIIFGIVGIILAPSFISEIGGGLQ